MWRGQQEGECYDPPHFSPCSYPSLSSPDIISFKLKPVTEHATKPTTPKQTKLAMPEQTRPATPMETRPLMPQWSHPSQVVMTRLPPPAMSIYPPFDLLPIIPDIPLVPEDIHHQEHSLVEHVTEPPKEQPLEDSPIEDAPTVYYLPDVPGGNVHTLHPERTAAPAWKEYHDDSPSPEPLKCSVSPTSPSSAPIRQCITKRGDYHSISPTTSSPIAGTSEQSQEHQSTSSEGSANNPSFTQNSADDADSDMALNWVTINTDYLKG